MSAYQKGFGSHKEKLKRELELEIAQKQKALQDLDNAQNAPVIEASEYSTEDKVAFFDKLHSSALTHLKEAEENGYTDDDSQHYMYEEMFTILNIKNKKALWDYFNSLV